jgi:dihydrodipicolinate synthase/N-acetylneuraminate lyase
MALPVDLIRPRAIRGISAVLLPFHDGGHDPDWHALEAHVARTAAAGLTPAVNMDTGYVHLLDPATRQRVLETAADVTGGKFVAGALDVAGAVAVREHGGTPVVVPNDDLGDDVLATYRRFGAAADRFVGFELSPVFHPAGSIWDLATYEEVLHLPACIGAKHSSLSRQAEWDRLRLRDAERPDFLVLTGNDLAIDMVMYGSDYLLGLSTFAPDLFAARDRLWADADPAFYELNDALQHLGNVAFRPPVPAYRHSASVFLRLRGWLERDATPPGVPRRPDGEEALLRQCGERLGLW